MSRSPARRDQIAGVDVLAADAHVGAGLEHRGGPHPAAVELGQLGLQDRIGAGRDRRAGGDAERGARLERRRPRLARRDLAGQAQLDAAGVGGADRVAVHRGAVERRQVDDAAASSAATRPAASAERDALGLQRRGGRQDELVRLGELLHPPMRDIERAGWTKPSSPMWCLSSLRQTASRMICSSSASLAPARIGSRRSVSLSEKRQVRSMPSAVRRMRLQSPQNGSLTGEMKPISPCPSAKRQRRAVPWRSRPTASSGYAASISRRISSFGQHLVGAPRAVGVERHELDEPHHVGRAAGELGEAHDLVLGEVLERDHVDLDRAQLGVRLAASSPSSTWASESRRVSWKKRSGASESSETLMRFSPARTRSSTWRASR